VQQSRAAGRAGSWPPLCRGSAGHRPRRLLPKLARLWWQMSERQMSKGDVSFSLLETVSCEADCKHYSRKAKAHLHSIFALPCWT
jgi:hypothetical protein